MRHNELANNTEHAQSNDTKQIKGAEFTDQVTTPLLHQVLYVK